MSAELERLRALEARLLAELEEAEAKAWDSLARYKFFMFGYWAAVWVHLNRIGEYRRANPWSIFKTAARQRGYGPVDAGSDGEAAA